MELAGVEMSSEDLKRREKIRERVITRKEICKIFENRDYNLSNKIKKLQS